MSSTYVTKGTHPKIQHIGGSELQGHYREYSEFKASIGYMGWVGEGKGEWMQAGPTGTGL